MRRGTERFGKTHLKTYPGAGGDTYEMWKVVDNKTGASLRISMPSAFTREGLTDKSLWQDFQSWYETWWHEDNGQLKKKQRRYKKR